MLKISPVVMAAGRCDGHRRKSLQRALGRARERRAHEERAAREELRMGPEPELKGSIGEGPNHSNHSNRSNHSNSFKIQEFSLKNSKISENFNIF